MGPIPPSLQALCLLLDLYLILRLDRGMPKNYLIFSLVRSLIRAYAQWLMPEQWEMIYWWGELVGYIVTIVLIAGVTERLLKDHANTALFYASMVLVLTVMIIWHLSQPVSLHSLWLVGSSSRMGALFLLLLALALGKGWDPLSRWVGAGIALNLVVQWVGGWFQFHHGSDLGISLIHQLGFLNLQLCWLVGLIRLKNQPTVEEAVAHMNGI